VVILKGVGEAKWSGNNEAGKIAGTLFYGESVAGRYVVVK